MKYQNFGWIDSSLVEHHAGARPTSGKCAEVRVHLKSTADIPAAWSAFYPAAPAPGAAATLRTVDTAEGVKVLVSPLVAPELERDPSLRASTTTRVRDAVGASLIALERLDVVHATYDLDFDTNEDAIDAALLGLELALYRYKRTLNQTAPKLRVSILVGGRPFELRPERAGVLRGRATNLARHLVNLPPNLLDPVTYADFVAEVFGKLNGVTVEVWDETRLAKEKCGLILAVGRAAHAPPRLVRLSYRPANGLAGAKPVALVGKGITFDSGGLDIKPAAGMRLMKKDMGGSAAVLGAIYWAALSNAARPIDAYVALAENAIGPAAFRPGDVVTARSGQTIEIHNTDAEGRLVLADAMDVAAEGKPSLLVDVATLTGAIKVALGGQLAGLFANDDDLGSALAKAGSNAGDYTWRMPLVQRYRTQSNSNFADVVNAVDGFGGAITAALFLEKFARDLPWAHLDIYAWKDSAEGAWAEAGGSGQGVLLLTEWLDAAVAD